jgi:hypothetical protein
MPLASQYTSCSNLSSRSVNTRIRVRWLYSDLPLSHRSGGHFYAMPGLSCCIRLVGHALSMNKTKQLVTAYSSSRQWPLPVVTQHPVRHYEIVIAHFKKDKCPAAHVTVMAWSDRRHTPHPIRLRTSGSPFVGRYDLIMDEEDSQELIQRASAILYDLDWLQEWPSLRGPGRRGQCSEMIEYYGERFVPKVTTVQEMDKTWRTTINLNLPHYS